VFERWPSGEYLVTARFHAAFAGAWAGSKVVVIANNEKLRAAARDLACPSIEPDADEATVLRALQAAAPVSRDRLLRLADQAHAACADFVRLITASRSAVAPDHGTP
jgi:polysaccharide pyruvyl transferase WcaK-like protein